MAKDVTIAVIDAGTSKVLTLIGRHNGMDRAEVLGAGLAPTAGIRKGVVVDAGAARESIRESMEDARIAAGVLAPSAFIIVSSGHLEAHSCWSTLHSMGQDAAITEAELDRAVDAARPEGLSSRQEVLHKLPRSFAVDGLKGLRNPIGMHALRIDVETVCVTAEAASINALVSAVESARVRVDGIVAGPVATAEGVLSPDDMERGVALMDIGGGVTTVAVFRNGALWNAGVLPLGGNQFTTDLSLALNIAPETAEDLKVRYGQAALDVTGDESVEIESPADQRLVRVERRVIARYLHERAGELFRFAGRKLNEFGFPNLPPAGLVLTGGGSTLRGIERVARQQLGAPVRFAFPEDPDLPYDLRDPAFSAGVGALHWASRQPETSMRDGGRRQKFNTTYAQANAGPLSRLKDRMSKVAQ
ncbi:MAG: cell division protein FtsA [Chloroflexi bacterium]|nr:cell division protein FtsA [Chloroflexota bacterium]